MVRNLKFSEESLEQFARAMLPKLQEYYASEEGQRAFAEWKAKKEREGKANAKASRSRQHDFNDRVR